MSDMMEFIFNRDLNIIPKDLESVETKCEVDGEFKVLVLLYFFFARRNYGGMVWQNIKKPN